MHWIAPTLCGLFTGFGITAIFIQYLNVQPMARADFEDSRLEC